MFAIQNLTAGQLLSHHSAYIISYISQKVRDTQGIVSLSYYVAVSTDTATNSGFWKDLMLFAESTNRNTV